MPIVDAPNKKDNQTQVRMVLLLPEKVIEQYEKQAKGKCSLEKILEDRLRQCVEFTSSRPLYFNDAQRNELEEITGGHLIDSVGQVMARIRNTVSIKVGNVTVILNQQVLDRAKGRATAFRMKVEDWIKKEVEEGMERSVGMRPY